MRARIIDSYRWNTARACAGTEFIKGEYRAVPPGLEDEARNADFLEVEPEPQPEPPAAPVTSKQRGKRAK